MRYAVARYNQYQRDTAYRIYVTDTLRIIGENTGSSLAKRWIDIVYKTADKDEGKTAVDIATSIPGLEVKQNGSF